MRTTDETIYILLAKDTATERAWVEGVYDSFDLVESVMEEMIALYEEQRSFKIESKTLVTE